MDTYTRNLVRRYLADPTPENASRALASMARGGVLAEVGSLDQCLGYHESPAAPYVDTERTRGNVVVLQVPGRRLCYSYGVLVAVAVFDQPEGTRAYYTRGYSTTSSKHALAFAREYERFGPAALEVDGAALDRLAWVLPTETLARALPEEVGQ